LVLVVLLEQVGQILFLALLQQMVGDDALIKIMQLLQEVLVVVELETQILLVRLAILHLHLQAKEMLVDLVQPAQTIEQVVGVVEQVLVAVTR
jgi:hypothetical protein